VGIEALPACLLKASENSQLELDNSLLLFQVCMRTAHQVLLTACFALILRDKLKILFFQYVRRALTSNPDDFLDANRDEVLQKLIRGVICVAAKQ